MSGNTEQVRSTTASGVSGSAVYESGRAVEEYLQFHFGGENCMPYGFGPKDALHFAQRCGEICCKYAKEGRRGVAYDIGCAVGGTSFELSKGFDRVVGVDFSHAFIAAAEKMKQEKKHPYRSTRIADIRDAREATLPEGTRPERCTFEQGDACTYGFPTGVDCIVAANLLCRLPDPVAFLQSAADCLASDGILVLVSPFSWLEEYTPKDKWMGGTYGGPSGSEPIDSATEVTKFLTARGLVLEHRADEPFLIREHIRKYQYGVSDCMVWRKK